MTHFNTSAKDSINVEKAFEGIGRASVSNKTEDMYLFNNHRFIPVEVPNKLKNTKKKETKKNCCA